MLKQTIANIFGLITRIASEPDDTDEWRLRKTIGLCAVTFGGTPIQLGYGILLLSFN